MQTIRTFLFAPANHPRRVEKAFLLDADAVILDLEDACAVSEKEVSRDKVVEALAKPRKCLGYVRINPLDSHYGFGDILGVVRQGVDGILLPKTESVRDVQIADWMIGRLERERGLKEGSIDLMPLIETGKGLGNLREILGAKTRIRRVAFGAGDFSLDMNLQWTTDELELLPYRNEIVMLSRWAGLEPPIDTVWINLQDTEGFAQSAHRAKQLGFQGKLCIYPDQVPVVNEAFTPSEKEVQKAQRLVDAFEQAEREGSSSFQLDGQFIDYPILYAAQKVLALHEMIQSKRQTLHK